MSTSSSLCLPLFEAGCAACSERFAHPSLGDFVYGQLLLCSEDGRHHARVDGFAAFPAQVATLLPDAADHALWPVLAALADPPEGSSWSVRLHCPHCGSAELAFQQGQRCGSAEVPMATFPSGSAAGLAAQVAALLERQRPAGAV